MGGLGGHMAHLHEDIDLTFGEIKDILATVASANIEVTEKVDGYNLFLTVLPTGEIRTFRNAGDVNRGGMTPQEYADKWKGHPAEFGFMRGFSAISQAIRTLGNQVKSIFKNGSRYLNMEIMHYNPETGRDSNIINYGASYVVLHGFSSFDDEDLEVDEGFQQLVNALNETEVEIDQGLWQIYGPQIIPLFNIANGKAHQTLNQRIDQISADYGGDSGTLSEYVADKLSIKMSEAGLSEDVIQHVVQRAIYTGDPKTYEGLSVNDIKKIDKKNAAIISSFATSTNIKSHVANVLRPIERIISDFAIEVLRGIESFFAIDHDKAVQKMRQQVEESIIQIRQAIESGAANLGEMVDRQLEKLGEIENIASSLEGIVFRYDGKNYKLTGAFAMVNQIVGRAMRLPKEEKTFSESYIRRLIRESLSRIIF